MAKRKKETVEMALLNPNAAGIDVGSTEHWVAIPEGRDSEKTRRFTAFTCDLHQIARWLKKCGITTIAMESTGTYWLNLFLLLEDYGFEVFLVNARNVKNVSGRKTDMSDAEWIQKLHSCGLLSNSFQPDHYTRELRTYTRHRQNLIRQASRYLQHMQKSMEQMNLKLHKVIRDLAGKTGMLIISAILNGERDTAILSELRDRCIRASKETIMKSLEGTWREEYLFTLQQAYDAYRFVHEQIRQCDEKIERALREREPVAILHKQKFEPAKKSKRKNRNTPKFDVDGYLKTQLGVDITQIDGIDSLSGLNILGEIGTDFNKWPTRKQFLSWLNLVPNNKQSGGKLISSHLMNKKNTAGHIFRKCGSCLWKSKGPLGDYYRIQRAKNGGKAAAIATGNKLASIVYTMVKQQVEYDESILVKMKRNSQEKRLSNLKKKVAIIQKELEEVA
ncbi:IS110 family transposase [Zunongwangia pacifica]|uniref:IS110 family transposase n=1 Tax=Zunongwangia pacifica TaxID=2911062 RepID=A0A9X2CQ80_9FLAO|nr:IS110 family transposase [Zunongwangia pacifica]MCL6220979.1 IS110 family transposase [Zunongwangia pacifica]